ncbi:MmcQ/YjbR family DNA-binding protein [Enterococcus sp. AZ101]|uniref:MmcQ/YjbR family DNA-binding protein n=1 Tax=Enterococcus sp. AZ101 TaxID=2774742 RepID=UPI003D2A51E7
MKETIHYLKEEAKKWPGATVNYREDWDCDYFGIEKKCFCMLGTNKTGDWVMTVKGDPKENELLREQYSDVIPGYYANKTHWNSFLLEKSSFTDEQLAVFLRKSYTLVFGKLTKKVQAKYE